jgi:hypothetical protein
MHVAHITEMVWQVRKVKLFSYEIGRVYGKAQEEQ